MTEYGLRSWSVACGALLLLACGGEEREDPMQATSLTGVTAADLPGDAGSTGGEDMMEPEKFDLSAGGTGNGGDGVPTGTCEAAAMAESNQGCEFWAVDLPNVSVVPPFTIDTVPADPSRAPVTLTRASFDRTRLRPSITIEPVSREGDLVPSFGQQRFWFLSQLEEIVHEGRRFAEADGGVDRAASAPTRVGSTSLATTSPTRIRPATRRRGRSSPSCHRRCRR